MSESPAETAQRVAASQAPTNVDEARLHRSLTNITPSPEAIALIEVLRQSAKDFGSDILGLVPGSRERSLAVTALEDSVMWAIKAICLADKP